MLSRALGGLLSVVLLVGLSASSVQAQKLQVVHNAPGASTADIYVDDGSQVQKLDDVPFRGAIVLDGLPTETSITISLNRAGSTSMSNEQLTTASVSLSNNANTFGQVFAVGDGANSSFDLLVQSERSTVSASGSGFVDLLIGHQSPDAGAVDVLTRGAIPTNINGNRPNGITQNSFTPQNNSSGDEDYYTVPFEDYIFRVGEDDNSALLASVSAALTGITLGGTGLDGKTVTVLASGYATPGDQPNVSNPPSFALIAVPPVNAATADEVSEAGSADDNVLTLSPDSELQSLVVNEYFADPGSSQDTDGDGDTQDDAGEEFIELLNITDGPIDVSGYTIENAAGASYTFPQNTSIPGGEAATVFISGADPTGIPGFTDTGSPQLNNSGRGDIILMDGSGKVRDQVTFNVPNGGSNVTDLAPQNNQESATRSPDGTGDIVNSTQTSTGDPFTPGRTTDGTALPVELARFDATVDGQTVSLRWKTLSETNNTRFEVQRKTDEAFRSIGSVDGAGTTTEGQSYRYTVSNVETGTHAFRLKQVDVDGSSSFSPIVEVQVGLNGPVSFSPMAPNPVQGTATASLVVKETQEVTVELYNTLGQRVRTLHTGTLPGGERHEVRLSADDLSSGVYLLRAEGNSFTETRKVTIVE